MTSPVVHFEAVGKDGAQLRDFYAEAFGWQMQVMPGMDYGLVDNGGRGINGGIGSGEGSSSYGTFYVAVPDPQATLDRVESLGGKTVAPVTEIPNIVTFAQFTDPEGNLVGIVKDDPGAAQPPSSASPSENPVTWFEIVGKDGKKLREFYGKIFGWQTSAIQEGMDYEVVEGSSVGIGTAPEPHATFYVEVADPAAELDKIKGLGGSVVMPAEDLGMVTIGMFNDPAGNLVGVYKSNQ
jgi:predicted enzyme related to lactoylglutathione lyase